jgi:hypothetical protein
MQGVEDGNTIGAGHHRLAVQGERPGPQLGGGYDDGGIADGPIVTASPGEQAHHGSIAPRDQAIAVVLDLVHPAQRRGRLGGKGRDAGIGEAIGADAVCEHEAKIGALGWLGDAYSAEYHLRKAFEMSQGSGYGPINPACRGRCRGGFSIMGQAEFARRPHTPRLSATGGACRA